MWEFGGFPLVIILIVLSSKLCVTTGGQGAVMQDAKRYDIPQHAARA